MGDFNLNLMNYDSNSDTNNFVNTLGSYYSYPHILKPTRITEHSVTLIDNIFFNSLEHQALSGNILSDITDHLPNFLIINKLTAIPNNLKIHKRDFSKLDKEALLSDFQSINWTEVLPCNDTLVNVNDIFQSFYSHVSGIIDKHVPIRKLTRKEIKSLSKPWITKNIRVFIKMKDIFYKKYLTSKNQYL